jgi:hypothetical protein
MLVIPAAVEAGSSTCCRVKSAVCHMQCGGPNKFNAEENSPPKLPTQVTPPPRNTCLLRMHEQHLDCCWHKNTKLAAAYNPVDTAIQHSLVCCRSSVAPTTMTTCSHAYKASNLDNAGHLNIHAFNTCHTADRAAATLHANILRRYLDMYVTDASTYARKPNMSKLKHAASALSTQQDAQHKSANACGELLPLPHAS